MKIFDFISIDSKDSNARLKLKPRTDSIGKLREKKSRVLMKI